MTTAFHWFLPTSGDGHGVGSATVRAGAARHERAATVAYLARVALTAEKAGFTGALTPVGSGCPDPWLLCAAVAQYARRLRFLVAVRAGFTLPTLVAQQAQTFQSVTGNRLALNIVTGGDPAEQRAYGDFLDHDERYARTDEYLDILIKAFDGTPFDFLGAHYRIEKGGLTDAIDSRPPIYFGGVSPRAEDVAARHADVYLMWGEPPDAISERIERMKNRTSRMRFGLRLHVIVRDTADEAWAHADLLLTGMDPERVKAAQERFSRMDSVGQRRMTALNQRGDLEIAPNLWAGIGLVREGAGTALVGDPDDIAKRIEEYRQAGVDEFILSGWPHVEEAERVGRLVLPRVASSA
jgi:alkanesulfonate monooxygenase